MLRGVDVSVYQGNIDWRIVETTGEVDFAYARATIGVSVDIKFKQNWDALKDSTIRRGAYHFYKMDRDPVMQAKLFFETVGRLEARDLPPCIDVEVHRLAGDSATTYVKKLIQFIEEAEELFDRKLVIYTGGPIFNECTTGAEQLLLDAITTRDLWLSAYVEDPTRWVPNAWKSRGLSWTIWQKSGDVSAGGKPGKRVKGIPSVVDYNVTQGNAAEIDKWVNASVIDVIEIVEEPEVIEPVVETPVHIEPSIEIKRQEPVVTDIVPVAPVGIIGLMLAFFRMILMLFTRRG